MTTVDGLWYLADEATQQAERTYHRVVEDHDGDYLERTYDRYVSRGRFRTLAARIRDCGTPFGAHTLVADGEGRVLLVRHDAVGKWVLPGGGVDGDESLREAARRELQEEAGIDAAYDGLAMLVRVEVSCDGCDTWGVMPVFAAEAETTDLTVADPDGEISDAGWFDPAALPADTRDREDVSAAARRAL